MRKVGTQLDIMNLSLRFKVVQVVSVLCASFFISTSLYDTIYSKCVHQENHKMPNKLIISLLNYLIYHLSMELYITRVTITTGLFELKSCIIHMFTILACPCHDKVYLLSFADIVS